MARGPRGRFVGLRLSGFVGGLLQIRIDGGIEEEDNLMGSVKNFIFGDSAGDSFSKR